MAKRGLIITYYFPPSGGGGVQRWTKFVKYLTRLDWQLTVITAAVENTAASDATLLAEIPAETQIIRPDDVKNFNTIKNYILRKISKGYWQRWSGSLINITDSRKSWNNTIKPIIDKELDRNSYDAVIFSLPPYSLAELAAHYTENLAVPVFLDMRDPWTKNPYKIYPTALHRYLDEKKENKVIARIKNLICAYQSIPDGFEESDISLADKAVIVIPNGYDEEDFNDLTKLELPEKNGFQLAFSGSFYSHLNKPDALFEAIKLLAVSGVEIQFHHIGESVYDLRTLGRKYGISDRVTLWGYKSHGECLEILNSMDAFCVMLDPGFKNADKTIGGKVYEYLRLMKPILAIVPEKGEAANLVLGTKSGLVCSSNNAQEISAVLQKIISASGQFKYSDVTNYRRDHLAQRLDNFISEKLVL